MCGSIGTDRDGYRDQIFLISACIQNQIIVEYLDCDFVGVRMVTFSVSDGSGVVGREARIFSVECEM